MNRFTPIVIFAISLAVTSGCVEKQPADSGLCHDTVDFVSKSDVRIDCRSGSTAVVINSNTVICSCRKPDAPTPPATQPPPSAEPPPQPVEVSP